MDTGIYTILWAEKCKWLTDGRVDVLEDFNVFEPGFKYNPDEIEKVGERMNNLARAFNSNCAVGDYSTIWVNYQILA